MKNFLYLLYFNLLWVGCMSNMPVEKIKEVSINIYEAREFTSMRGDTINYRLFIPYGYNPNRSYPLILFHHGAGGRGNDNIKNLEGPCPLEWATPERQAKNPAFIVAPQIPFNPNKKSFKGPPSTEEMTSHIQTIHEILNSLENEFSIDTNREYVTGLSMGGESTWMSLLERPNRFAAAVPICAGDKFIGVEPSELGKRFSKLPLWLFHGELDQVISVDISRTLIKALRDAGGEPNYTEYPKVGHDSWELAYRDSTLIEWLFDQSL